MKKMQKWIALLLAVLMLSAIFAGLRKTDEPPRNRATPSRRRRTHRARKLPISPARAAGGL